MAYALGVIVGILITLGITVGLIVLIFKFSNSNGKMKNEYDERQKAIRGEGYKYGFYAAIGCLFIMMILDNFGANIPMSVNIQAFTTIIIAAMVDIVYCVKRGAYWGLNNNRKRYIWVLVAAAVLSFIFPVVTIMQGEMIVDGYLNSSFINLECGVFLIAVLVMIAVSDARDKAETEADEEE